MCDYQGHEFGANYPDSVCIDGLAVRPMKARHFIDLLIEMERHESTS